MANLHSGYEPEPSITLGQRQSSEFIELDLIHHLRKEADNLASTQASSHHGKTAPVNKESARETTAFTSRPVSIYDSNIELNGVSPQHYEAGAGEVQFSLPPVDTGKDAWLFLFSAFIMDILVWGFPFAFGIFQEYYSSHPPLQGQRNIAIIGTCALGLMYLSSPLVFGMLAWYPTWKRPCIMIGLIIMCLSLGLSSLSMTVPHLIATQGVFYAIGAALCYSPTIGFMDEWFVKRKGLAFGIMWAGTGLGGAVIPLLLQFLLDKYGFRTTLRIWAVVFFVSAAPLYMFLKPRLPVAQVTNRRAFNVSFVRNKAFLLLQLGNVLESFGYFVPSIYLPTIAKDLGASNSVSSLTLILINMATVFGCVVMGWIVYRYHVTTCILISTLGSTLSVFLLWGFSSQLSLLLIFCFMCGLFAGCFTTTYPGIMKVLNRSQQTGDTTMVFAILVAGRGIGNVACGPLSEVLIRVGKVGGAGVYGNQYGPIVIFTGVSAALSGVSCFGRRLGWF